MTPQEMLRQLSEDWFLSEPAFFALYCQQQLVENVRMECPVRCGQQRLEYNPLMLAHKNYQEVCDLMRIELIRLFLKHPYERRPEGCGPEAITIGSNITIADGYCLLHHEKLPLQDPSYYHLPLGMYYEWYAKQLQNQNHDDQENNQPNKGSSPESDASALWRDDSLGRQNIDSLIERTTDWGTLPADIVERIKASTKARIDRHNIWKGYRSAILSSQRQLTRMRPNRRTGFIQMGSTRQYDTQLLVAIDVSGSISAEALRDFYSAIFRIFRYGMTQIDTCQFDIKLGPITPLRHIDRQVTVTGRGGTSYQPVFDFLSEQTTKYDGAIILTDGKAPQPVVSKSRKLCKILWVCQDRACYEASHAWMHKTGRVTYL